MKFYKAKRKPALKIIYEDDDLIVVDKPSGLLTIRTDRSDPSDCLYHQVYTHVQSTSKQRIFVVHRLDKDTSGLLVFAKNPEVKEYLQKQFENQKVRRLYEAVVEGTVLKKTDRIKVHLFLDKFNNVFVGHKGDIAITDYTVYKVEADRTIVDISLVTGKRNQIRASFAYIGHPLIGDRKYGGKKGEKLALRAYKLVFEDEDYPYKKREFETYKKYQK